MGNRKPTESKFAEIFQKAAPAAATAPARIDAVPPLSVARPLGRPHGKRSDPAWKQFSVLLKKQTQREAVTILRSEQAEDESRDLSDLLQELLDQWVAERRQS